jgi:hypothetical protein
MKSPRPIQSIQVMQLLYRRHPEIGMWLQLPIKPRSSSFLRAHAQEVRAGAAGGTMMLFSIEIVVDSRFEWPGQTHVALFSHAPLKSKPEARLAAIAGEVEN